MSIFAISFRIHEDVTYENRYDSLVERIKKSVRDTTWEETTSFFLIESNKSAPSLCSDLYAKSSIIDTKDLLLVIDLSSKDYDQRGAKYPHTLKGYMQSR